MLTGVAPLQTAGPGDVSFLDNRKYAAALAGTRAGAVIVHQDMADRVPPTAIAIAAAEPYVAWARVAALFHPMPPVQPGVHPSAVLAADASIDPSAEIGPLAVICARAQIGPRCRVDRRRLHWRRRGARVPTAGSAPTPRSATRCSATASSCIPARASARTDSASRSAGKDFLQRAAAWPCGAGG